MVLASDNGDANCGEGDCSGDDDGGSSHYQKTVCLYDWWLIESDKEFQGKNLAVAGLTSRGREPVRLFTSAAITKRHDDFTLETADGFCVVLQGFINKPRTEKNGLSSEVFNHFGFGFPRYWEDCYQSCLEKAVTKETESEGVTDFTMPGTGLAESSPSSFSRKDEVFGEDKHNSDVNVDSSGIVAEKITVAASEGLCVEKRVSFMSDSFEERLKDDTVEMNNLQNVAEQVKVNANRSGRRRHMPSLSNGVEERLDVSKSVREADKETISPHAGNRKSRELLRNKKSSMKDNHKDRCRVTFDANEGSEGQSHMANLSSVVEENLDVSKSKREVDKENVGPRARKRKNLRNRRKGLAESKPSSSSRKDEVFGEDKHNSDVNVDSSGIVAGKITVAASVGLCVEKRVSFMSDSFEESLKDDTVEMSYSQNVDERLKVNANRGSDRQRNMPSLSNGVEERLDVSESEREADKATISPHAGNRKSRKLPRYKKGSQKDNHKDGCRVTFDANEGSEGQSHMANLSSGVEENLDVSKSKREVDKANVGPRSRKRKKLNNRRKGQKNNRTDKCSMKTKDQKLTPDTSKPLDPQTLKKNSPCKETHDEGGYKSKQDTRRKLDFDTQASTPIQERKGKPFFVSPESLNCKRSRSGRLILPPLDFWRNQVAVYDEDRKITGIQEDFCVEIGTKSEPRRKKLKSHEDLTTE